VRLFLVSSALLLLSAVTAAGARQPRATAYIFTTTDCPIANRYAPEIQRLDRVFAARGVDFRLVYVNPRETAAAIAAHAQKYGYQMDVVHDADHALVRRFGITVTPEAAVVGNDGRDLYRGRIDNRYVNIGVERPAATQHDLSDALDAIAQGRPVPVANTRAVGCIVADFAPVTFAKDIAPIVFDKCGSCHRPGGSAPFSLLTYSEVRQRASLIASVTATGFMPPYKAVSDVGAFVGQKRLMESEIALLQRWVDDGVREGDERELPRPPTVAENWQLGAPDLVVTLPEPFLLKAESRDVFRIFVIRLPVTTTKYVTGVEFRPGNAGVVHHANIRLDRTAGSRELDTSDPAPGYDGLMARSAVYPEGHFLGWTPGQIAPLVPPTMAWRLEPGTDLVVQLHMQPSGAVEPVQPVIGFFFSDRPPTHTPTILRLGSQGIDIAPGEPGYRITDSYTLPVDVELHAVQPHAHYRLRDVRGTATLPDGTTRTVIEIADWDFRWQHVYRFVAPLPLPRGTRVSMQYTYDNSDTNPRNPQVPPQRVLWGQRTFDEMGDLWFQFVTRNDHDRTVLNAEILNKMTGEDIIGYETMLRTTPGDAELHDDVAMLYLAQGHPADAVRHFRLAADVRPSAATAHFNLATALSMVGRLDEAVTSYREALRLRPDYAAAHNNLGSVLSTQGLVPSAIPHFRAAIRADAANVQAHRNLAWYVSALPDADAAARAEAIAAGEQAVKLTHARDAEMLDALAAAYKAAGRIDEAAAASHRARTLRNRG